MGHQATRPDRDIDINPHVVRRPAAQQEREWLQAHRLRAAELFTIGVGQAEIARQLGVSRQAVACGMPPGRPTALRHRRVTEGQFSLWAREGEECGNP
jgi:hypothetical protein